jgi:hypothetical protein
LVVTLDVTPAERSESRDPSCRADQFAPARIET